MSKLRELVESIRFGDQAKALDVVAEASDRVGIVLLRIGVHSEAIEKYAKSVHKSSRDLDDRTKNMLVLAMMTSEHIASLLWSVMNEVYSPRHEGRDCGSALVAESQYYDSQTFYNLIDSNSGNGKSALGIERGLQKSKRTLSTKSVSKVELAEKLSRALAAMLKAGALGDLKKRSSAATEIKRLLPASAYRM